MVMVNVMELIEAGGWGLPKDCNPDADGIHWLNDWWGGIWRERERSRAARDDPTAQP
jgi:hypothetical protein